MRGGGFCLGGVQLGGWRGAGGSGWGRVQLVEGGAAGGSGRVIWLGVWLGGVQLRGFWLGGVWGVSANREESFVPTVWVL